MLKKPAYPIKESLYAYLKDFGRVNKLPLSYDFLLSFTQTIPVYNQKGEDTLWESVFYEPSLTPEINDGLKLIYALLKSDGKVQNISHLSIDKIDYCTFGNSKPFRIKIINNINDNYDYFYVKKADASRVFGLELEEILSPNRVNFIVYKNTLIEEHIVGIPGDQFIENNFQEYGHNEVRLAKEFVKFNERCYRRLLGDMRAYNFIIDVTPDFDKIQYRIRAIDFDQQCYESRRSFYLPHYFKENQAYVDMGIKYLSQESVEQYTKEERSFMIRRIHADKQKLRELLSSMKQHTLSKPEHINALRDEIYRKEKIKSLAKAQNMGEIVEALLMDMAG
ncbi:MAG: hypothetical protein R2836_03550 [Chitinophagales bacterium]|nr:hypothetical protein [Bacteroidota bacterium]MCB9225636.1 hypothetical protein [Chitinophagales bacterium]